MADGKALHEKMHEYEVKVLTALGFTMDSPVVLVNVDPDGETVTYGWYGQGDPPPPRGGFCVAVYSSDGPGRYTAHSSALAPGVWDVITEARREWLTNFGRARHV